jgi:hypothetical protein
MTYTIVRSSRFLRFLRNLAAFLFHAALPLVGAWRRPHRPAGHGGEVAPDGDRRSYMGTPLIARHVERRCILGCPPSEQGSCHPGPRPGACGIPSVSSRGHVHEAGAVGRRGERGVGAGVDNPSTGGSRRPVRLAPKTGPLPGREPRTRDEASLPRVVCSMPPHTHATAPVCSRVASTVAWRRPWSTIETALTPESNAAPRSSISPSVSGSGEMSLSTWGCCKPA